MAEPSLPSVALRQHRERTIERLCEHFAHDHLEPEELEQLIDRAHRAHSLAELDALLAGLPALSATPAPAPLPGPPARPADGPQVVAAVMGGAERRGGWTPASEIYVVAFMGGVLLDFRQAHLERGLTEVNVLAMMGGVQIVVPPGVHVDSSGLGVLGGFEHASSGRFPVDLSVPVIRIRGVALMGGVEIHERPPGESLADARQLARLERRQQRSDLRRLRNGEPRDGSGWGGWDDR